MELQFTVNQINERMWALDQAGRVRSYLLAGEEKALLVDTCFGGAIASLCASLTDKPITLVNTHADPDHVGGNRHFAPPFMHPAELDHYRQVCPDAPTPRPLEEGKVLDFAPFRLEAVHLPGHTPGSIALLERERRFVLSGDVVSTLPIFLFGPWRNVADYQASLRKLEGLSGAYDTIYPSHGDLPLTVERLEATISGIRQVLEGEGEVSPARPDLPPHIKTYSAQGCHFLLEEF